MTETVTMEKQVWESTLRTSMEKTAEADKYHQKYNRAIWWLHEIVENHRFTPISTAEMALKELTESKNE